MAPPRDARGRFIASKIVVGIEGDTDNLDKALQKSGKKTEKWSVALGNLIASGIESAIDGMVNVVRGSFELIGGIMDTAIDDAISLESAFAGVTKTTEGLADEGGNLTAIGEDMQRAFRDLATEIPQDVEDLMGLGALGSQLGIQRENLIDFTTTMAMVGDATDLTSETAAQAFAQISNVMNTPQAQISNMASSVVELGNNMATTEPAIVNFAQRIAGAGEIAGLTEAEVFGISAAFSSVGIEAEAGGSAVQKVLLSMNEAMLGSTGELVDNREEVAKRVGALQKMRDELEVLQQKEVEWTDKTKESSKMRHSIAVRAKEDAIDTAAAMIDQLDAEHGTIKEGAGMLANFAKASGVSASEFKELWETDAAGAFQLFVEGLGAAGDDAVGILKDLELKDQRLTRAFLSLAGAGDVLSSALDMSTEAFNANEALAEEAGARYATTESQIAMFENTLRDLSFTLGGAVVPFLNDMLEIVKPIISEMGERLPALLEEHVIPALETVIGWFGKLVTFLTEVDFGAIFASLKEGDLTGFLDMLSFAGIDTSFLTDQIIPAFQSVVGFIRENVVPIFELIIVFFKNYIPFAIQVLQDYYEAYLKPVFESLVEQWETKIMPALSDLIAFLKEFIPQAIEQLSIVWNEVFLPALEWLGKIMAEVVIPILGDLVEWFLRDIPIALAWLMEFWTDVAWPAILTAITWFKESAWPVIELIVAWLSENIPIALEFLRSTWQDEIMPALLVAMEWFQENVVPILETLREWFLETLPESLNKLKKVWAEDVWPIIEDAVTIAQNVIVPIFEEIGRWINDNMIPWIEYFGKVWVEDVWPDIETAIEDAWAVILDVFEPLLAWWEVIEDIFIKFTDWIDRIALKTFSFKISIPDLPDWAIPDSPLPIMTAWQEFEEWSRNAEIKPRIEIEAVDNGSLEMLNRVEQNRTTNVKEGDTFNLTAQYPEQSEMDLIDQVRRLQLESQISYGAT